MNNDSVAVFVHGTYTFSPEWSLTVGMRQSWEQKEFTYNEIYPLLPVPFTDPGTNRANDNPSFPLTTLSDEWDVFTPKLGVEFKPKRDVLVYVQGSTGFKAGGFNGRPSPLTGLAPFGSEEIRTIETGFKSEWFERRVRLNGAYFFNSYRDIQISRLSPLVPGVRVEENAGDGRSNGFELEASGIAARGLTLAASLGYLDFEYHVAPARRRARGTRADRQHQPRRGAAVLTEVHFQRRRGLRRRDRARRLPDAARRLSLQREVLH